MLSMVTGCKVHDPSLLHEGYCRTDSGFTANVNAEKIAAVIEHFIALQDDRVFLILEIPTNYKDETEAAPGILQAMHKDVYYMDGLTKESAVSMLQTFGPLFIHDGMNSFGFGSHSGNNEIMLNKYNIITIYTKTPHQYMGMFESHDIPEDKMLKTAWDYFTHETPGECCKVPYRGKDIYEITEYLQQYGLYFSERRER